MEKQWYVVNTYSGHENKVKEKLEMRAESMGMEDYIFRVVIPEEKVVEVKDGVTGEKVRKGVKLPKGRHWRRPPSELTRLHNEGLIER